MLESSFKPPLHMQLKMFLLKGIEDGNYKPGDMLPAESELVKKFKASRGTVRKAYDALVHEGLVVRRSGQGSFVSETSASKQNINIGVIVPSLEVFDKSHDPLNWELKLDTLNGIISEAAKENINIELCPYSDNVIDSTKTGFIILDKFPDLVAEMNKRNILYAYFNLAGATPEVKNGIEVRDEQCFYEAISVLAKTGHRKIGIFSHPEESHSLSAYCKVLSENKIAFDPDLVQPCLTGTQKDGYDSAKELYSRRKDIDGIFCRTDIRAFGALDFFKEAGIEVPRQISIMGFDNIRKSAEYSLTTYETPRYKIGRLLLNMFKELLKNPDAPGNITSVTGRIIKRLTVKDKE